MLFEVGNERKLTTSVAVGGKFKRKYMFVPRPHISKSDNGSAFRNWLLVKRLSLESKKCLLKAACKRTLEINAVYKGKHFSIQIVFSPFVKNSENVL